MNTKIWVIIGTQTSFIHSINRCVCVGWLMCVGWCVIGHRMHAFDLINYSKYSPFGLCVRMCLCVLNYNNSGDYFINAQIQVNFIHSTTGNPKIWNDFHIKNIICKNLISFDKLMYEMVRKSISLCVG